MDVEAARSIRQAKVGSVRVMIGRVSDTFDLKPEVRGGPGIWTSLPLS